MGFDLGGCEGGCEGAGDGLGDSSDEVVVFIDMCIVFVTVVVTVTGRGLPNCSQMDILGDGEVPPAAWMLERTSLTSSLEIKRTIWRRFPRLKEADPGGPTAPSRPFTPGTPGGPTAPSRPFTPSRPFRPFNPFTPGTPGGPCEQHTLQVALGTTSSLSCPLL